MSNTTFRAFSNIWEPRELIWDFFHSWRVRGIPSLPDFMNFCNTKINIKREECDKDQHH